jgi:hypothetical protein
MKAANVGEYTICPRLNLELLFWKLQRIAGMEHCSYKQLMKLLAVWPMKIRQLPVETTLKQDRLKFHCKFWSLKFVKGRIRQKLRQNCTHSPALRSVSTKTVKIETRGWSQHPEMGRALVRRRLRTGVDSILGEPDSVERNQQTQQHSFRLDGITIYTAH